MEVSRRRFLAGLAALPFVGALAALFKPKPKTTELYNEVEPVFYTSYFGATRMDDGEVTILLHDKVEERDQHVLAWDEDGNEYAGPAPPPPGYQANFIYGRGVAEAHLLDQKLMNAYHRDLVRLATQKGSRLTSSRG